MVTFYPGGTPVSSSDANFFTSGNYIASSFSTQWSTRLTPDVEGLNTPVYLLVLDKFNIPASFIYGTPPGGTLPGIDIKRMPAIDAIRLSLAESMASNQWWDIYEDNDGGVYFQRTYPDPGSVTLDVRLCVPSSSKTNFVDLVIVRGYKQPPTREILEFKDVVPEGTGDLNPQNVDGSEDVFTISLPQLIGEELCHSRLASTEVYKSYKDPVIVDSYRPQEANPFYSVKAFEQVIGYVRRISGMPEDPSDATRIKYSFSTSTPWYLEVDFPTFSEVTAPTCSDAFPQGEGISYFEGKVNYTGPDYLDRYGYPWPLILRPTNVFFLGNKLNQLLTSSFSGGTAGGPSPGGVTYASVSPITEFLSMDAGGGWLWNVLGRNEFEIVMYYQPKVDEITWEAVLAGLGGGQQLIVKYSNSGSDVATTDNIASRNSASFSSGGVIGAGSGLGYLASKLFLSFEIDRPCVKITDPHGEALLLADSLHVEYAPIILTDPPAPIAFFGKDGSGIVDQSVGLEDSDPTTVQNFEESEIEQLQDKVQGNVIDVSLPFCGTDAECLNVATTLYNYMHHVGVDTFVLTCGPDSEPRLGATVDGYGGNLVIDSISYSYNDSSSYTIDVSLAPIFNNVGSWNNGFWIKKTETVDRSAIVRWVAGDGVNYRVEVQGLGMYNAISGVDTVLYVGDVVQVRIYNNPVEA